MPGRRYSTTVIGSRGEAFFLTKIMQPIRGEYLFLATFLGGNFPAADYLVNVVVNDEATPHFFFVQVKTTTTGFDPHGRLQVRVSGRDLRLLQSYGVPTYIAGVDDTKGQVFLLSTENRAALSSLPARYPLDAGMLPLLQAEILAFWRSRGTLAAYSQFV